MGSQFIVATSRNRKFRVYLTATNRDVVLTGQVYTAKPSALRGVESIRTNVAIDSRFLLKTAKDGSPYFVLLPQRSRPRHQRDVQEPRRLEEGHRRCPQGRQLRQDRRAVNNPRRRALSVTAARPMASARSTPSRSCHRVERASPDMR